MKWSMLQMVNDRSSTNTSSPCSSSGSTSGAIINSKKNDATSTGNTCTDVPVSPHMDNSNNHHDDQNYCTDLETGVSNHCVDSSAQDCHPTTIDQRNDVHEYCPKLQHRRKFHHRSRTSKQSSFCPEDTDNTYDASSFTGSSSGSSGGSSSSPSSSSSSHCSSSDSIQSLPNDNYSNARLSTTDTTTGATSTSWLQQLFPLRQTLVQRLQRVTFSTLSTIRHALPSTVWTLTSSNNNTPPATARRRTTCMSLTKSKRTSRHHNKNSQIHITFRKIHPSDKNTIQQLHEQWFPVKYLDEFYDDLVYERMACTGDPLFTCVGTTTTASLSSLSSSPASSCADDDGATPRSSVPRTLTGFESPPSQQLQPPPPQEEVIVACVVGCFINATTLSRQLQRLLISNSQKHSRLFYIMTVGTTIRNQGIGTLLIEKCVEQVLHDKSCGVLYLHVLTTNMAAIQMYEQLGFHRVIEIPNYYTINNVRHNCYLYAKYYHGNRGQLPVSSLSSPLNILQSSWYDVQQRCTFLSGVWNNYFLTSQQRPTNDNDRLPNATMISSTAQQ